MPIALSLIGQADLAAYRLTRSEARDWLVKAAVWFEGVGDAVLDARLVRESDGKALLLVTMHPATPPIEVRLGGTGRVRVTAVTSPAGPGYHIHLCELLRHFATDFDLTWDVGASHDSAHFFADADRAACERCFLQWASEACATALQQPPSDTIGIGMPAGHGFTHPGPVLTPLGPRGRDWLASVARDGEQARDFFAWWNPDLDAAFYRDRALTRLWCNFPWRPPLHEAEGELTDQIANDLATAYKLDPAGELPWREWLEVLAAIDNDEEGHTVTPADPSLTEAVTQRSWEIDATAPLIGYRRFALRVPLCGGWSVEVPGDFAREWEDERTWTAWNRSRTVWFHALGFTKPDGSQPSAAEAVAVGLQNLPPGDPVAGLRLNGLRGEAVYGETDEDGRTVWRLSGVAAVAGQLVVCNAYSEDPVDRDWATHTWQSLRHIG